MDEFKSNSNLSKKKEKEEHHFEKVVEGAVRTKPRSKFAEVFIQDDIQNVKNHILADVLIPALKNTIFDSVMGALKMMMFGEKAGIGTYRRNNSSGTTVPYNRFSENTPQSTNYVRVDRSGYKDPVFEHREDAEEVRMRIEGAMSDYGVVSILDLYEFCGLQSSPTDNKYGWMDIRTMRIDRNYDGTCTLKMPRPVPLD